MTTPTGKRDRPWLKPMMIRCANPECPGQGTPSLKYIPVRQSARAERYYHNSRCQRAHWLARRREKRKAQAQPWPCATEGCGSVIWPTGRRGRPYRYCDQCRAGVGLAPRPPAITRLEKANAALLRAHGERKEIVASYHPLSHFEGCLKDAERRRSEYRLGSSWLMYNKAEKERLDENVKKARRQIERWKRLTDESILWEKEGGLHEDGRVKGNEVEATLAVQREEARLKRKRIVERQRRASIRARSSARASALETTSPDGAQRRSDTGLYS